MSASQTLAGLCEGNRWYRRSHTREIAPDCARAEVPDTDGCGHRQCRRVRAAVLFPATPRRVY